MTARCSAEHCLRDILGTATLHLVLSTFDFIFFLNISLTSFINLSHFQFILIVFLFPCMVYWVCIYLFLIIAFIWSMKNSKGTMQATIRTILFCITARIHTIGLHLILKCIVKIRLLWQVQWHREPVLSGHDCINIYTYVIPTDFGKY